MAVDRDKNTQIKVTIPKELHSKLRAISDQMGIPLTQMMLQAVQEKYKDELRELDRKGKD